MTPVTLEGEPPFSLPVAQGAIATERDGLVWATFSVLASSQGPMPIQVEIGMTGTTADLLGQMLLSAAADAAKARK
jgi:hypothetical protein